MRQVEGKHSASFTLTISQSNILFYFLILVDGGVLYPIYAIYYLAAVLSSIVLLVNGFRQNEGLKKKQTLIILWAAIIGFSGGMTNFLPQLFNVYPFGTFIVFLYPILITYGIFMPEVKIRVS